jgi:hypothetical protein
MATQFHETDVKLQRGVGKQAYQVGLRGNLQWHEVQNNNTQRSYVLGMSPRIGHHENILILENVYGWKTVRQA